MIELLNATPQTVAVGQSVPFTEEIGSKCGAERHRAGSAQLTLVKPGRYLVSFAGNIAVPATGGTVGEISLGIALNGEPLTGSIMRVTPAAISEYFNVAAMHYIDVPCGCCVTITVQNTGASIVDVDNPNLTAVRVCG